MISYDPKDWLEAIIKFQKSDTLRRLLPWIFVICCYSGFVAWLELEYWKLSQQSNVRNINLMHTLLGVVLSFLLVFRTNTAYERWWEARKLWGSLVNNSRNLAIKLSALIDENDEANRQYFRSMIPLIAETLKNHLRQEETRLELFDNTNIEFQHQIDTQKHLPNQVIRALIGKIYDLERKGKLTSTQLLTVNAEMQSFADITGACERIKNTPIPYSYSSFIKKFILIYVITLPFGFVFSLGYLVVPIVGFIFYVLASLELIAEEIEDPFGPDENDLPLMRMTDSIKNHIHELI